MNFTQTCSKCARDLHEYSKRYKDRKVSNQLLCERCVGSMGGVLVEYVDRSTLSTEQRLDRIEEILEKILARFNI